MINQIHTSKAGPTMRLGFVQTAVGLALAVIISAFGIFIAAQATGQENMQKPARATANVLPPLYISEESLQPNLNGALATGDGGAVLPLEEIVGGVSRDAFDRR